MTLFPRILALLLALTLASCGRPGGATPETGPTAAASAATDGGVPSSGVAHAPPSPGSAAAGTSSPAPGSAGAGAGAPPPPPEAAWPPPVLDLHTDVPWQVGFKKRSPELPDGNITPDTLARGNYGGVVFVLYLPHTKRKPSPEAIDGLYATAADLVGRHKTLRWGKADGAGPWPTDDSKVVDVFLAIEGADAFGQDIEAIDRFIDRGVRYVGLLHSKDNSLGTSATGHGRGGLTATGRKLAERIYAKGALVDVSHMSDASFLDMVPIAQAAGAPLLASHSNARAVHNHPRNLTDEQLRAIGQSGGVAGVNLHRSFVRRGKARLEHVVAHVEHMVKVAGIEHVAIGSDFDGGNPVGDLADASHLPELADELRRRGMAEQDVHRIFWRNALRVLRWSAASK